MPLLSSLSKHIFLFLTLTIIWLVICGLFEGRSFMSASDAERGLSLLTFLIGEVVIVAAVQGEDKRRTLRSESAQVMNRVAPVRVALFEQLTQLPDFSLTHWCVLPSSTGAKALAVNADSSRIAIVDYQETKNRREPFITARILRRGEITSVTLENTILSGARGGDLFPEGSPRLSLASELLGSAGLPVTFPQLQGSVGEQPKGPQSAPPIANPLAIQRRWWLALSIMTGGAVEQLLFLRGEASTSDEAYLLALQNASYWQRLFEQLKPDE